MRLSGWSIQTMAIIQTATLCVQHRRAEDNETLVIFIRDQFSSFFTYLCKDYCSAGCLGTVPSWVTFKFIITYSIFIVVLLFNGQGLNY